MSTFNEATAAAGEARLELVGEWLTGVLPVSPAGLEAVSGDASFRRYFRVHAGPRAFVLMDAPPDREPLRPFVRIAGWLRDWGLHAPRVFACEPSLGFALLEDLGDDSYLGVIERSPDRAPQLYDDALAALVALQRAGRVRQHELPPYDRVLLEREIALFPDWLLNRHLALELSAAERAAFDQVAGALCDRALAQPAVFVHRDYHSRNLMVLARNGPGILDFQDAVEGPLTYDLVSLLKDCYLRLDPATVSGYVTGFHAMLTEAQVGAPELHAFVEDFHWMGVQRHLKAAGIFARLWHRDGKPGYLADLPRTLDYIVEACEPRPELRPLGRLVAERVLPALERVAAS